MAVPLHPNNGSVVLRQPLVFDLDADLVNADWLKTTWDLPIDNIEDLRKWIAQEGATVEAFKARPIYRFNVDRLPWLQAL